MTDLTSLCNTICDKAREVGKMLRQERGKLDVVESQSKGIHDYVTRFDKESERRIVDCLSSLIPSAGFIAEEGTVVTHGERDFTWIVDPLDGTTNFIHGLAPTCISIALQDNTKSAEQGRPVMSLGVIYEIWADECFHACDGDSHARLNGKPIHVSHSAALEDSLLATGFPYTDFSRIDAYMQLLQWTMRHSHGVRRLGSAAADLAYTACGRTDAFYEYGLKPYDVAAGAYIIQKAGGKVCDFSGGNNWLHGGEITASNPLIFDELNSIIQQTLTTSAQPA